MRVIAGKGRPQPRRPAADHQVDAHRVTAFATNTKTGGAATLLPDLELRHRRARCEDRIRISKDTGLMNLPLQRLAQIRIWCAIVSLAVEITSGCRCSLMGADARPERAPSQGLGTQTIAAPTVHPPGDDRAILNHVEPAPTRDGTRFAVTPRG
jgi:hypothetical protein